LKNLAVRSGRASNGKIVAVAFAAVSAESVRRLTQTPLQPNEINMEKPSARGPSPSRKAHRVLGPTLNRKTKPPPNLPAKKDSQKTRLAMNR
jgi:hypothetical protein